MASHATTNNAVPASEGRQQGMYSSTGIGSKCHSFRRYLFQASEPETPREGGADGCIAAAGLATSSANRQRSVPPALDGKQWRQPAERGDHSSFKALATSPHATYLKFCGPSGKRL